MKKIGKTILKIAGCLVGILMLAIVAVFIFAPDQMGEMGNRLSAMIGTRIDSVYVAGLKARRGDIVDWSGKVLATGDERIYPYGELAQSVIGTVRFDGDSIETSGIEAAFNKALSGKDGYHIYRTNLKTGESRKVRTVKPKNGVTVPLALDMEMQACADSIFRAALAEEPNVRNACMVVADVNCGGIRAMVNLHADADGILREGFNTAVAFPYSPGMMMAPATALAASKCDTSIDLSRCDLASPSCLQEMFAKYPLQSYLDTLESVLTGEYCDFHFEIEGRRPITFLPEAFGGDGAFYRRLSLPCGFGFSGPALSWLRFHTGIARGGEEIALRFVGVLSDGDGYIVNDMLTLASPTCNLCTREQAAALTHSMTQAAEEWLGETEYGIAGLRGSSFTPYEDGRYHKADGSRSMQSSFAGFFPTSKPAFSIICMVQSEPISKANAIREIPLQVVKAFVASGIVAERIGEAVE